MFDAVIGADVAAALDYEIGDKIVIAHGLASFSEHGDKPFQISGILEKTGTPVDRTVHVSLEGIEAVHVDWKSGAKIPGLTITAEQVRKMDLTPKSVTAALVGTTSRLRIFSLQRWINEYNEEPLLAVLPGVALQELWEVVGVAETALSGVSAMVVVAALLGMAAMILAGLNERRREMAILRAVGARPHTVGLSLMIEAALLCTLGVLLGLVLLYLGLIAARPLVDAAYGLYLPIEAPSAREAVLLLAIVLGGMIVSLGPRCRLTKRHWQTG